MVAKPQRCKNAWQLCTKPLVDPGSSDYIVHCSKGGVSAVLAVAGLGSIPEEASLVLQVRCLKLEDR